jgi:hypothetical protein
MRRNTIFAFAVLGATLVVAPVSADDAPADSSLVLKGSEKGTTFRSLTVEAENRVQIEFDRPELQVNLDPASAPGLEWGSAHDVLDRSLADFALPFIAAGRIPGSPYLARPWLNGFRSGELARFTPQLEGVERWTMTIADSKGRAVRTYSGKGTPPKELSWDGLDDDKAPALPGLTYSFVLNAYDRAGNERNFVGDSFLLPPYRQGDAANPVLMFAGEDWKVQNGSAEDPLLLEIASRLNQTSDPTRPVLVRVHARSYDFAQSLGDALSKGLAPRLIGAPGRIVVEAQVDESAPRSGSVQVALAKGR